MGESKKDKKTGFIALNALILHPEYCNMFTEIVEHNTLHLFGVLIEEPMAVFTDFLFTAACWFFAFRIHKYGKAGLIHTYYKLFFLLLGLAVLCGGLFGHAFHYCFDHSMWAKTPGWLISMVATVMLERAAIEHTRIAVKPSIVKTLNVLNIVEYFTFLGLSLFYLKFIFIELHSAYGLLVVVFFLELLTFLKRPNVMGRYTLAAVAVAFAAGFVHIFKVAPATWFDELSLSHLLMIFGAWLFYLAAMRADIPAPVAENEEVVAEQPVVEV